MYIDIGGDLRRIEKKLDHLHDVVHALVETVAAIATDNGDMGRLAAAGSALQFKSQQLQAALDNALQGQTRALEITSPITDGGQNMPNPTVDAVIQQVAATDTVIDSAVKLINGFHAMMDQAVKDALANGATAAELAPVTDALVQVKAKTAELSQAVAANTPAVPPGP